MWLINVVGIFSYFLILILLVNHIRKSKEVVEIIQIVISFILFLVFANCIINNKECSNFMQVLILFFTYILPSLFIIITYSSSSLKLELAYYLSYFMFKTNKYEEASVILHNIVKKDDKNIKYLKLCAKSYEKQNKYIEARDMYARVLDESPKDPYSYYNLGRMFDLLEKKDTALIMFSTAAGIDENFVEAREMQALMYSEIGRDKEAINIYEQIINNNSENPMVYYNLASIYLKKRNIEKAIKYYTEAINIDSTLYDAMYSLANIYFNMNDFAKVEILVKKLEASNEYRAKSKYIYAKVLMNFEKYEAAIEALDEAFSEDEELIKKAVKEIRFENILPEINRLKDKYIKLEVIEYIP